MSGPSPKEIATDIADDFTIGGTPRASFIDIVGDAIRDYSAKTADRIAELEAELQSATDEAQAYAVKTETEIIPRMVRAEAERDALRKALEEIRDFDGNWRAGIVRKMAARSLLSEGGGE